MKKISLFLALTLLLGALAGCNRNVPQDDDGHIQPSSSSDDTNMPDDSGDGQNDPLDMLKTQSCQYLAAIWEKFPEAERFAAYGGTVESATDNAPGELDMQNTEELTTKYLLPQDMLESVSEGASLVHMMNSNIFTAAVVKLRQPDQLTPLYEAWRNAIQNNRWICGQPDRLLMAKLDQDHLLMSFGSTQVMDQFATQLKAAVSDAEVLYQEAVVS